jgi:alpha-L-rhamnosidase
MKGSEKSGYINIRTSMKNTCIIAGALLLLSCSREPAIFPTGLTCEYLVNPTAVDVLQPRLSWINVAEKSERGQFQSAYQVRVASSREKLEEPDLWDSGKQDSEQSFRVKYEGRPLASEEECWWQVRVWDRNGSPSGWSELAYWRMGLLDPVDWKALWIGAPWQDEDAIPRPPWPEARPQQFGPPAPMLRKEFTVKGEVASAVAFVTGLGYFELYLNGRKVGEDVLIPNQTNYGKRPGLEQTGIPLPDDFTEYRVMYLTYDISDLLVAGDNAIGGILGNGFYNPGKFWAEGYGTPRFLCQVHLTYKDGTEQWVISDDSWKAAKSPILMDMVYWGEVYDARMEQPGWCTAGFKDSLWEPVALRLAPWGKLVAHTAHPDRVTELFDPVSIRQLGEGHYLVDFGTEISGWVRLNNVEGPEGHRVEIRFNGNLYSGDNAYIFSGKGPESYAPRFNWFVFSGVEIINWPGELRPEHLVAEAVHTEIEATADFGTSNELFNGINTIWRRSQTDNMHGGIASDCPHRERSPYTGDGQLACITVLHNYDARNFYQKWVADMRGAQIRGTGYVPNGAPWQPGCGGGPAWGAAICVIPWEYYVEYGARDMLEDNFDAMKGYVRYMLTWTDEEGIMHSQRRGRDGSVLKWFNLGEWVPPGKQIPDEMVHTFYLWYCSDITSRTAAVLGKAEEEEEYRKLAASTREAFHNRFYDEASGSYGDGGGNVLALKMGVPREHYEKVVAALKAGILKNGGHLDTGIIGTRFFFEVLAENGLNQLAYEAMNQKTEPSFGRWIALGSTTTREHWSESGSFNHPMFGGGLVWFYRNLAGMQADPYQPGYRHIVFRPQPVGELEFVSYRNRTSYGDAGITWKNAIGAFEMEIIVPVGCEATIHVPADQPGKVMESGRPAKRCRDLESLGWENGYALFRSGSGTYRFRVLTDVNTGCPCGSVQLPVPE